MNHLLDIEHLRLVAAMTSLWVSVDYLILGGMIMPILNFPLRATILSGAFFVGCALTHVMIAGMVLTWSMPGMGPEMLITMLYLMVALHVIQGIGGTGFIVLVARRRLVVRLEE